MEFTKVKLESTYNEKTRETTNSDEEFEVIIEDLIYNTPVVMMELLNFKPIRFGILRDLIQDKKRLAVKTDVAIYEFKIL